MAYVVVPSMAGLTKLARAIFVKSQRQPGPEKPKRSRHARSGKTKFQRSRASKVTL